MPDQYSLAQMGTDEVNLTVIVVVLVVVALAAYVVKRGNHELDFNWGWADLRLLVRPTRPRAPARRARRRR